MDSAIVIVHADAHCLVVDKPAGLLAVPGRGADKQDCLAARVQATFDDALVVHRLDMATSGLMLFARGAVAQRRLSEAFAQRQVHKRYVAVVQGCVAPAQGEIDLPLIADWPQRPRQKVDRAHGKPSLTRYRVVDADAAHERSRVELEPVTGRAHQLRVHLCAIGHPILGDALYAPPAALAAADRLLLHAAALRFAHPASGAAIEVESGVPF
jgi:tRNA pseudouridine32 synthase/23S rRNA pseudouridine746 synthase